jgi:hypothetical protein
MKRKAVSEESIHDAMRLVRDELKRQLATKGKGTFASTHEIWGALDEEVREFKNAVHDEAPASTISELSQVAVAAIFGIASIRGGTVDW